MNDRFKFRVWWNSPYVNEESKYLYYNPNEFCHTTDIVRDASCDSVEDIVYYDIRDIILGDIDEFEKPNTFIVEQCTGLKDNCGNLIYEGDIIGDGEDDYVIKWDGNRTMFVAEDIDTSYEIEDVLDPTICVIGNIHEQAEQKDK